MDAELLQGFIKQTEEYLPLARGGILVCASSGGGFFGELSASVRQISSIGNSASILGLDEIAAACARLESEMKTLAASGAQLGDEDARLLLDRLAELEVLVAEIYFGAQDFPENVSNFIEESFGLLEANRTGETASDASIAEEEEPDAFEIDDEMLEVFALEADELVRNFSRNLELLQSSHANGEALSELRRSAHTLKGAAGVVGVKPLAQFAHRVEDLLDFLAENEIAEDEKTFALLLAATDCFDALAHGESSEQLTKKIARVCQGCDEIAAAQNADAECAPASAELKNESQKPKPKDQKPAADEEQTAKAVVRVSLEKLDELVNIADGLNANRFSFAERIGELNQISRESLEVLFERQCRLIDQMQTKLLRLRTVRFGSLAARLQRTVRVACEEEEKRAELQIAGDDLEIDTLVLDGLVEPLLHLLRNAVAHGVEAPDLRRLLGKPETGKIVLSATIETARVVVRVSDDGRGISADALREKAVAAGLLSRERADRLSDGEAFDLIYLNGLTTAETLRQTAGRGVGMNAVKTGIERRGGAISIESKARKGTTFTVSLPTVLPSASNSSALSVLIVDDSPSIRQATSGAIKRAGWKSQTAENGLAALEILADAPDDLPDVILTDAEMPQMDGYAFLTALKTRENLRAIPVVMITSRDDEAHRRKAVELGVSDFLGKPCDNAFLLEKIRHLTSRH